MALSTLTSTTSTVIETYGNAAKNVVSAYRAGNARAAQYLDQSWASALEKAGSRLGDQSRQRALKAQQKISGAYVHAVTLSADGAEVAINKALDVSGRTIAQLAANADRFGNSTAGGKSLAAIAQLALPAAQAVHKLATTIEAQSERLLHTVEGAGKAPRKATTKRAAAPRKAATKAAGKAESKATPSRRAKK